MIFVVVVVLVLFLFMFFFFLRWFGYLYWMLFPFLSKSFASVQKNG